MSTPHNRANPGDFAKTVLMPGDPLPCLSVRGKTKAAACWQPPGVVVLCCNIFGLIFPVCLPA